MRRFQRLKKGLAKNPENLMFAMEKQLPNENDYAYQLRKLTEELANNPKPSLWEE